MPFGVSWGCFVASIVMAECLAGIRVRTGTTGFGFIDDGLVTAATEGVTWKLLRVAVLVARGVGMRIQLRKLTRPARCIEYLGLRVTMGPTVCLTLRRDRWPRLLQTMETVRAMRKTECMVVTTLGLKALEKLAGQAGAAAMVVPHA